jgi:hypothetical protein
MNIRKLNKSDYNDILIQWWRDWGWKIPPSIDMLPDEGESGAIVYQGDVPVCAGFIYTSNASLCWISWIISNKEYRDRTKRKESIKALIETLSLAGKNLGAKYCYVNFNSPHLVKPSEELGFIKGSVTQEMLKIWDNQHQRQDRR